MALFKPIILVLLSLAQNLKLSCRIQLRYFMISHSPNKLTRAYQCAHQVSSFLLVFYVFIFNKKNISDAHIRRIKQIQDKSHLSPLGFSKKDYKDIESTVLGNKLGQKPKVKMILVCDVQYCQKILEMKKDNGTLKQLHEVYVCYKEEDYLSQKLLKDYNIINKEDHDLQVLINTAERISKKLKEQPTILRNYRRLDDKDEERRSFLMKVRANGAIHLDQRQYDQYYRKFKTYLEEFILNKNQKSKKDKLSSSKLTEEIQSKLQNAIKLLKQKRQRQFNEEMLSLYQAETVFYEIINKSLMEFTKKNFPWQSLALPFCLLYKAVKLEFHEESTIDEIFNKKDQVTLLRAGKISEEEHHQLKNALPDKPFFQMSSFISASLRKSVAYKFLDKNDPQTNCMMEIKLKRPHTKKEIQKFSFLYQSYAKLPNVRRDGAKVDQSQILLNALSVGRLINIRYIKYKDIKNKSQKLSEKFKHVLDSQSIPVLQFQMGNFQNFLTGYTKQGRLKMTEKQQKVVENYLYAIDSIKNYQKFDIGHSLQLSGEIKEAQDYCLSKLNVLQKQEGLEDNQVHQLEKKKSYHQICHRLSQTSFDLGMEQQALNYIEISIQTYKMVKQLDKSRTKKEHNRYLKKMYQEVSGMLIAYKRSKQAKSKIMDYIKLLEKKASVEQDREIYFQYRIAEYLLDLGIISFKEGQIPKALTYFEKSQGKMKKIKKEIDYDSLKNQSFYPTFIFACIFTDKKWENKNDYFQQKRAYNISQAANIVGAQQKFNAVFTKTAKLKQNILTFMKQVELHQTIISEANSQDHKQDRVEVNMIKKIEDEFEDHPFVQELKPAFKEFFASFRQSLESTQDELKNGIDQKYKNLVQKVIKASNQKSNLNSERKQEEIRELGQDIVRSKLYQWQKIDYLQNESAINLKSKIDNLVIHLKESQAKVIQRDSKKSRQAYHNHLKSVVTCIQKSIYEQEKFGFATPTLTKIKKKISCATIFEQEGEERKAEEQIQSIINDAKSNPHFILEIIEGYLLSIKIYYSNFDFDFANCLLNVSLINKKKIQKIQKDMIQKCKIQLKKAEEALNEYQATEKRKFDVESRILNQNNLQQQKVLKNTRRSVQINNSQKNEKLINNSILKKRIQLNLWKQKCLIFQLSKQQNKLIEEIKKLSDRNDEDIRNIDEASQITLKSFFNQNRGYQEEKLLQTHQSFAKMKESYQLIAKSSLSTPKAELITKIVFMFVNKQSHSHLLSEFEPDLYKLQRECANFPYFWRICLAVYFIAKNNKVNQLKNIEDTIKQLQLHPSKNESFKLKLELLTNECKELRERINFFNASTVSKYISQSAIQRNSYINNSQNKSKLVRKESKNTSRASISKRELLNEQKTTNQQKISIQIEERPSFEERFKPLEPKKQTKQKKQKAQKEQWLYDLPQQSINSKEEEPIDNEDNVSEKYEPYSFIKMQEQIDITKNLHSQELRSYEGIDFNPHLSQQLINDRNRNRHPQRRMKRQSIQVIHRPSAAPLMKDYNQNPFSDRRVEVPSTPNIQNCTNNNKRFKRLFSPHHREQCSGHNSSNSSPFKSHERESSYSRLKRQLSNNSQKRSFDELKRSIIRERSESAQKGKIASANFLEMVNQKYEQNRQSSRKRQIMLMCQNAKETSISRRVHSVKNKKLMSQHFKQEHFDNQLLQS